MTALEKIKKINNLQFITELRTQKLEVFVVGGAVRDLLLNKNPKDIDLIVTGGISIEKLASLLEKYGKVDLVGESFAVIKFKPFDLKLDEPFDIAIPRTETKNGNGHKGFEVSTEHVNLKQDLKRRDFTINSIAMTLDGNKFIDPFNGKIDIKNKKIKATNPTAFTEDPLRILRAIQFASRFGFDIDNNTFNLMKNNVHRLKEIPGERIVGTDENIGEFTKIIKKGGSVKTAVKLLTNVGFFKTFNLKPNKTMPIIDEHFKTLGDFMHLLLFFEDDMETILANRFKADNNTKKQVKALKHMHTQIEKNIHPRIIATEMIKITPDSFLLGNIPSDISEVFELMKTGKLPTKITDLNISGDDMIDIGLTGKHIGEGLETLFKLVLFEKIPNKHSVLKYIISKLNQ